MCGLAYADVYVCVWYMLPVYVRVWVSVYECGYARVHIRVRGCRCVRVCMYMCVSWWSSALVGVRVYVYACSRNYVST